MIETSLQNPEPLRNSSEKMKLVAHKYCASITHRTFKMKPKKQLTTSQLKCNGDDNFSLLTKKTSTRYSEALWKKSEPLMIENGNLFEKLIIY